MGLNAQNIDKASQTISDLSANGVTFNVSADDKTLNTTGFYLILMGIVTGAAAGLFSVLFKKALG